MVTAKDVNFCFDVLTKAGRVVLMYSWVALVQDWCDLRKWLENLGKARKKEKQTKNGEQDQ